MLAPVVLVTGATGLIGRHVVTGWAVPDLEPVPVDSSEDLLVPGAAERLLQRYRPSVVLHLAWTASGTPSYRNDERNASWVTASLALERACSESGAWFIGTGTAVDAVTGPADPYSSAKATLRQHLSASIDGGGCSWLRPYYVVDPERRRPALVAEAIRASEAGVPVRLRTPDSHHDFVHAADVASAAQLVVQHRLAGDVPIGSGAARPVTDLVTALGARWEPDVRPTSEPHQSPQHHHEAADIRRLRDHGWTPVRTKEMFHGD